MEWSLGPEKGVHAFEADQLSVVYVHCRKHFALPFLANMVSLYNDATGTLRF